MSDIQHQEPGESARSDSALLLLATIGLTVAGVAILLYLANLLLPFVLEQPTILALLAIVAVVFFIGVVFWFYKGNQTTLEEEEQELDKMKEAVNQEYRARWYR
jgi:hypothetical protein